MKNKNQGLGLVFIVVGIILFISKFQILHRFFNFNVPFTIGTLFNSMVSLWPITLIVIGLNILLNRHTMLKIVIWASFIVVLVLYASYGSRFEGLHFFTEHENKEEVVDEQVTKEVEIEMETAEKGELKIDLGACDFKVWGIGGDNTRVKSNIKDLNTISQYKEAEKKMMIKIEDEEIMKGFNKNRFADVELSTKIPWDIKADIGAIKAEFNLKKIKLDTFNVDVGAGNVELYLGDKNTQSDIYINGGASNISIYIPEDCGVKVIKNGSLMNVSDHFGLKEDFTSEGYEDADSVFDLYLNANAANLEIYSLE